jgi:8-oxo-dGTP diphosphatase
MTEIEIVVRAVIIHDGRILLSQSPEGYYAMIGGHVEVGESLQEALKRELKEELQWENNPEQLIWVIENRFLQKGSSVHEIGFYFWINTTDKQLPELNGYKFDNGCVANWIPINELNNIVLLPKILSSMILELSDIPSEQSFIHRVNFE